MIIKLESVKEYTLTAKEVEKHNKKAHTMGVGVRKNLAPARPNEDGIILTSDGSYNQGMGSADSGGSMGESLREGVMSEIDIIRNTLEDELEEEYLQLNYLRTIYHDNETPKRIREVEEDIDNIEDILDLIKQEQYDKAIKAYEEYVG